MINSAKKEDLRVRKTKAALASALCRLILEKDFDKITVTSLCNAALVNKKTFYTYYKTVADLLETIVEGYLKEFLEHTGHIKLPDGLYELHKQFLIFSSQQDRVYERLICSPAYNPFGSKMLYSFVQTRWNGLLTSSDLTENQRTYLIRFLFICGTEFYRQWVRDGKTVPLSELIEISGNLLCSGTYGIAELSKQKESLKV